MAGSISGIRMSLIALAAVSTLWELWRQRVPLFERLSLSWTSLSRTWAVPGYWRCAQPRTQ